MYSESALPWWRPTVKTGLHVLFALPLAVLVARGLSMVLNGTDDLGVNPIETVIRNLGDWALRFLIIGLAVTPCQKLTNQPAVAQFRRMIGLWAFTYVALHLTFFVGVDQFFDWKEIGRQIVKNKFICVGMIGFAALFPLAVTSTRGMVCLLGFARWKKIHKLVYVAAVAGSIHYIWMVKADIRQPLVYAGIVAVLLGLRVFWAVKARLKAGKARAMRAPVRNLA